MASLYRERRVHAGFFFFFFFCGAKVCSASHQCVHTAAAWHMWNERVTGSHFLPVLCQFNQEPLTEAFAQCILMHDGIAGMAPPHRGEAHALQVVWETRTKKTSSLSNRVGQIQTTDKCGNYNIQKQRSPQKNSQKSNTASKQDGWHQMDSFSPFHLISVKRTVIVSGPAWIMHAGVQATVPRPSRPKTRSWAAVFPFHPSCTTLGVEAGRRQDFLTGATELDVLQRARPSNMGRYH